jgi:murein peptide amidase A
MRKATVFATLTFIVYVLVALLGACTKTLNTPSSPTAVASEKADSRKPNKLSDSQATSANKRESFVIGRTIHNNPIQIFVFGAGEKHIVVLGGIHGNEPAAVPVAEAFISSLESDTIPADVTVVIIPNVNPDGLVAGTRTNSNSVDINRNFPSKSWRAESAKRRYYPGKRPASEEETRAVIDTISKYSPLLLISIHAPFNCINWDGPAEDIARVMSRSSGYPLQPNIGYETPGSLGSYAGIDLNIPAITIELRGDDSSADSIRKGVLALHAAIIHTSSASISSLP